MIHLTKKANNKARAPLSSAILEIPDISIISNREANIFGTKGIIEYRPDLIKLNCGHLILTIKGSGLTMVALSIEEVNIKGLITSLDFCSC